MTEKATDKVNEKANEHETKPKKSEPEFGLKPKPKPETGSPTTRPCANMTSDGTAAGPDPASATASAIGTSIPHALSLLFSSGSVVELRALGDGGVKSGYFTDFEMLADRARTLDAFRDVSGVYVTLNTVDPALLSRRANRVKHRLSRSDATTADADIIRRRWLPIDLDPVRPSGVSATDAEHAAALRRAEEIAAWLTKQGFPDPVFADSGNGAHLLYRIDLPNDDDATHLVKGCLGVLDGFFSDDAVHCDTANFNAGRIWKLYGTTACKGDSTDARPHRMARILSVPEGVEAEAEAEVEVVPESALRRLADLLPTAPPAEDRGRRHSSRDLRWWLDYNGIPVASEKPWHGGTLFSLASCPFSSAHTDGAFAIQFPNGAVFAGCHHDSCGGGTQRWPELRAMYEGDRETERNTGRAGGNAPGLSQAKPEVSSDKKEPPDASSSPVPPVSPLPDAPAVVQEHRRQALEILTTGDPLSFLLDVFHRDHVGDRAVAECLIMSVASQSVQNTSGLHVAISGTSGKGKTHACNAIIRLLPEEYRLKGTVSNKVLFYDDSLRAGTVFLFDDVSLSDDMQEVLKSATANFREPIEHRTLTRERQLKVCTIPERCVWWLAKVESVGDDQVMNRMLTVWIDDSFAQDIAVLEHRKTSETGKLISFEEDTDVPVCRAIWEILKGSVRKVVIPFAERIGFSVTHNRRNPGMLFDLIKCHALLHVFQRETDENGTIIATPDDFLRYARHLYLAVNGEGGGQETKLTRKEAAALASIATMDLGVFTIKTLQDVLGLSYKQIYRLLHGYTNSRATYTGILDKCPAVSLITASVAEELSGMEIRRQQQYFSFDRILYHEWAAGPEVWLKTGGADGNEDDNGHPGDGGGDLSTFPPAFHQNPAKSGNKNREQNENDSCKKDSSIDICTDSTGVFHPNGISYSRSASRVEGNGDTCDPAESGNESAQTPVHS